MKSFKDAAGREWEITVTLGATKRVRELLKVDLLELEAGNPSLLTRLGTDIMLLCDVIFALVKPQADKAGVTDEQFGEALDGDAIRDAQAALYDELGSFYKGLGRHDLGTAIVLQPLILKTAVEQAEAKIEDFDIEARIAEEFSKLDMDSPKSAAQNGFRKTVGGK